MKTTHSFQNCEHNGPPSSVPHGAGWVGVTGALDQTLFMESWALYGSGGEKADALSMLLINPGACFVASLQLSCGINSNVQNHPPCAFDPQRVLD
jgi:hypothetical protein